MPDRCPQLKMAGSREALGGMRVAEGAGIMDLSRGILALALLLGGCATAHRIQISDIDSSQGRLEPFEVQVSATGISASDAAEVGKLFANDARSRRDLDNAESVVAATQMGPKTGDPTLSDDWADDVALKILARCPNGRVTGLSTRRETMDYPVISGEIVTIKGYCIL
jgi:hypothetical protein